MNKYLINRNADAKQENGGAAPIIAPETPAQNVQGTSKAIVENKPSQTNLIGTIAEVSRTIVSKVTGKPYRLISLVGNDQKSYRFPISESFYENNADRLVADKAVSLTIDHTVEGKTTYTDNKTGELMRHTSTGETISNIVSATSQQAKMGAYQILEGIANKYAEQPALAAALLNATATLLK